MSITNQVVNKAIDYIIENLHKEICIDDVASHCNFSKYHFSRVFRAETGESLYSFIKRLRLERSAVKLGTNRNRSITDIGLDYGYSSSNYSSAFRKQHNLSPAEFRKLKSQCLFDIKHPFADLEIEYEDFNFYNSKITIKDIDDLKVVFKRYIGSYRDMDKHWQDFISNYSSFADHDSMYIEVSYDDPKITDLNRCIYDLCLSIKSTDNIENTKVLKGGKFAVYNFKGSVLEIFHGFKGIFNVWIPNSGYELDDRIGFTIYRSADCKNNYFEMDICIPIK